MYLLNVKIKVSEDKLSKHVDAHLAWIRKHVDSGLFLLAGPRFDKQGGVIIACLESEEKINELLLDDPMYLHQCVDYTFIGFDPAFVSNALLKEGVML